MEKQLIHDAYTIFNEVFHTGMSYEAFRHKHMDNPERDEDIMTLVHYQDGVPAGTNSFMGCFVLDGNQEIYAVTSCDTAVKTAFRGNHIFSLLIQRAMTICQERKNTFLFGFPNQNSYPGFIKLDFEELGGMETWCAILRPVRLLLRKALGRGGTLPLFRPASASREGNWSLSLRCPFSEEDLTWINSRPGVHFRRTMLFYQWKIDYLPEGEAAYLCARSAGRLEAFLVLRRYANGSCDICDWLLPEDGAASRRLLKSALRLLRPHCDLITVPMVNPASEDPERLSAGGFFRKKGLASPFMIYPTADLEPETLARLRDLRNWTLRYIDGDTILNG